MKEPWLDDYINSAAAIFDISSKEQKTTEEIQSLSQHVENVKICIRNSPRDFFSSINQPNADNISITLEILLSSSLNPESKTQILNTLFLEPQDRNIKLLFKHDAKLALKIIDNIIRDANLHNCLDVLVRMVTVGLHDGNSQDIIKSLNQSFQHLENPQINDLFFKIFEQEKEQENQNLKAFFDSWGDKAKEKLLSKLFNFFCEKEFSSKSFDLMTRIVNVGIEVNKIYLISEFADLLFGKSTDQQKVDLLSTLFKEDNDLDRIRACYKNLTFKEIFQQIASSPTLKEPLSEFINKIMIVETENLAITAPEPVITQPSSPRVNPTDPNITEYDFSNTWLDSAEITSIIQALANNNTNLRSLRLNANNLLSDPDLFMDLASALRTTNSLENLHIEGIEQSWSNVIFEAIKSSDRKQNLIFNGFTQEQQKEITEHTSNKAKDWATRIGSNNEEPSKRARYL